MNNSPCIDCPDREYCDKAKCCKYKAYLAKEARQNADKAWFQELNKMLDEKLQIRPLNEHLPEGKPLKWKHGEPLPILWIPCAEVSCLYNIGCHCTIPGYQGPTMEGSCKHYERD